MFRIIKKKTGEIDLQNSGGGVLINGKSLVDYTHPINTIYLSKDPTSPAQLFGGVWEQLTADAYLKIVTANGGIVGGTSADHKIPIESMPSHTHDWSFIYNNSGAEWGPFVTGSKSSTWTIDVNRNADGNCKIYNTGGGQPYYPHYYGIYAWIRVE